MRLAKETVDFLKNFSSINSQIMVRKGKVLRTISPQKTIMAQAELEDELPVDFAIYELSQFISALSLFQDADIDFHERFLDINGANGSNLRYVYASPENIITPPNKEIRLPSKDVTAQVTQSNLASVIKAAAVLSLAEVSIFSDGKSVSLVAGDTRNKSSNAFRVPLDHHPVSSAFTMTFKTENLVKLMSSVDYELTLSSKGLSHFKSDRIQYWVPTESTSKFGE